MVVLMLLVAFGRAEPQLTMACHRVDHAAPRLDACLNPKDFRTRYGPYLKQVAEQESCSPFDGCTRTHAGA